jgi:hypothetical protein
MNTRQPEEGTPIVNKQSGDAELREVIRKLLGIPDPEPDNTGNVVPNEGRTTGAPGISPDQYARDFVNRVAGRIPAHSPELPEQEYRP